MTIYELENGIRSLLIDFERLSGREINSIRIYTRNDIEIFLKEDSILLQSPVPRVGL
jgi:hypothetical protein